MTDASPTVRQRELAKRMRELRQERGLTVENVADKLLCSPAKVSRLETGARRASLRDIRDLCELYGVGEPATAELMGLARKAREQGWWAKYEDLKLNPYIGLEQSATSITAYSMYYVPALMQTEDYARSIIKAIAPKMTEDVQQQRVEARLRRQERLQDDDLERYRVLLDEAVLHRQVGGPAVMAAQLDKILRLKKTAKVTVQVIPFDIGAHAAQDSNFVLLEYSGPLPPVVFVEGLVNNSYQERKYELDRYREAIDELRCSALSSRDSGRRVAGMQEFYASR